jgi:hypothetical protein
MVAPDTLSYFFFFILFIFNVKNIYIGGCGCDNMTIILVTLNI